MQFQKLDSQNNMIRPIQFRKNNAVNLNLLKCQLDRRVDLITIMIKGIKPKKDCSEFCCTYKDKFCQTQQVYEPLFELKSPTNSVASSIKSFKSPGTLKKIIPRQNKQNQVPKSSTSIKSKELKTKKLLISIQQSQYETLKTSRHKKLDSQLKKLKNTSQNVNQTMPSNIKRVQKNNTNLQFEEILNSFQNSKKGNTVDKKYLTKQKLVKNDDFFTCVSFGSEIHKNSHSKSKTNKRKNSINDSASNSNCVSKNQRKSFSNNNIQIASSSFLDQSSVLTAKRIKISEEVQSKIQRQIEQRQKLRNTNNTRQSKTNNIRISLLKRLQDKYNKANQVAA